MTNYKCTWCNEAVEEQDFDIHTGDHYRKQVELMNRNPSTVVSSVGSVSYVKIVPGSGGGTNF